MAKLDLSGSWILPKSAAAPSSPAVGTLYYDTVLGRLRVYDVSGWETLTTDTTGSGASTYLSSAKWGTD